MQLKCNNIRPNYNYNTPTAIILDVMIIISVIILKIIGEKFA